jgi:GTP cyclohydrolase N terminal
LNKGIDIRPTIAVTKAHMRLMEMEKSVRDGRLQVDGKIIVNNLGELAVTKGIPLEQKMGLTISCRGTGLVLTGCCGKIRD